MQDLRIFLETARLGSISACARQMDMTPAAASAAIKRLEAELDTLLFVRSTRSLHLTDKGEQFLPRCREALGMMDDAYASIKEKQAHLSGTLRLSSPSDFGRNVLLPWLDEFMTSHPKVSLRLHLSDSYADLYGQQIDLALRYGEPEDSSLIALPIAPHNRIVACASPEYLNQHKPLSHPNDLAQHNCLCLARKDTFHTRWAFVKKQKNKVLERTHVNVSGNRRSKDGDAVRLWAVSGQGVALKSYLDVAQDIQAGKLALIHFNEPWQGEDCPLNLLCSERRLLSPLVQALKSFLIEKTSVLTPPTPS